MSDDDADREETINGRRFHLAPGETVCVDPWGNLVEFEDEDDDIGGNPQMGVTERLNSDDDGDGDSVTSG